MCIIKQSLLIAIPSVHFSLPPWNFIASIARTNGLAKPVIQQHIDNIASCHRLRLHCAHKCFHPVDIINILCELNRREIRCRRQVWVCIPFFSMNPSNGTWAKHLLQPLIANPLLRENLHHRLALLTYAFDIQECQRIELRLGTFAMTPAFARGED